MAAGLRADFDPNVSRGIDRSFGCRLDGTLDRGDHVLSADALFFLHVFKNCENFATHDFGFFVWFWKIGKKKASKARSFSDKTVIESNY